MLICIVLAGKISVEYVWLGGTMQDLRCKTRVLDKAPKSVSDLPKWNYDGSSTDQAPGILRIITTGIAPTNVVSFSDLTC